MNLLDRGPRVGKMFQDMPQHHRVEPLRRIRRLPQVAANPQRNPVIDATRRFGRQLEAV